MQDSETQPPPNGFPWDAYHINWLQLHRRRQGARLDAQHVGGLPVRPRHRQDRVAARRRSLDASSSAPEAEFEWQHDVTLHGDKTVTLFDNHCCEITGAGEYIPSDRGSRALRLELDTREHDGAGRRPVLARGDVPRRSTWATCRRWRTTTCSSALARCRTSRSSRPTARSIFDAALPGSNHDVSRAPCGSGSGGRWTPRAPRARPATARPPSTPAGTARPSCASWTRARGAARRRRLAEARPEEASRLRSPVREGLTRFQVQALDANGQRDRDLHRRAQPITTKGTP